MCSAGRRGHGSHPKMLKPDLNSKNNQLWTLEGISLLAAFKMRTGQQYEASLHVLCWLRETEGRQRRTCYSQRNLPFSWSLLLFPLRSCEEQKICPGLDIPLCPVFGDGSDFGLTWTLKQHPTAITSQQQSRLWVRFSVWPNRLRQDGLNGGQGKRKQEAEVNCWGSEISTLNSAWQKYTKGACVCGSSFKRTEIMTLSDIPVKMSCLAQSPVIS